MPLSITQLRRWIAAVALVFLLAIAGVSFYTRHRVQNVLKEVPQKMGIDIQQTAQGFTVSKSEQGRTIFKVQASKAVQFKKGGRTQLHEVEITMYGKDASRFDRISGKDFEYDPQSGEVTANGEVQIELEANPEGLDHTDQSAPAEVRSPIFLKTSGLVFNQKTGDAFTKEKVEFQTPQARGSAMGVRYSAKNSVLSLESQVQVAVSGAIAADISASHGSIAKDPRVIQLDNPQMKKGSQQGRAQHATLFLGEDNTIQKVLASGQVWFETHAEDGMRLQASQLEILLTGTRSRMQSATFWDGVQFARGGEQAMSGTAGRLRVEFGPDNRPKRAQGADGVHLVQHPAKPGPDTRDVELASAAVNVFLRAAGGPERAETEGAAQITIFPTTAAGKKTVVTASKFEAKFDSHSQLAGIHGEPDARIVDSVPGQPDRVSTSAMLDGSFQPGAGLRSILQQGSVQFTDGSRHAWAGKSRYTVADQTLELTGSPRVQDASMTTTAQVVKMNRATGDAFAEGDVKSTYSDLKPQPDGALLASASPIHVTAHSMTAHRSPAVALYRGSVRLWQDANAVEAPSLEFDRDRRSIVAYGSPQTRVASVLAQTDSHGKSVPVIIKSGDLTYTDSERRIHFADGVRVSSTDVLITSSEMDAFLKGSGIVGDFGSNKFPTNVPAAGTAGNQPAQLERLEATSGVVVTQAARRARGERLVYRPDDEKFVLTGGPPSIFDAEHGEVTGVSLTFYKRDDTVEVEGTKASPTVTQTRVAR